MGGGGGGDVYSYIRVVPDEFLLKRKEFKNHIKGTRSPLSDVIDLLSIKLDLVYDVFLSLCKRSDDNIRLTVVHYVIKVGQIYTES